MPPHRDGGGNWCPLSATYDASSAPAIVHRSPPIKAGGIDSRLMRMPRYVVPQIRHTITHAT